MSKKVFFLIILLLIQLGFFPRPVSAVTSCKDSRIDWNPRIFPEGKTQYVINFTIQDTNTLETLKKSGPYVRLLVDRWLFNLGGIYTNPPVKIEGSNFSIVLTGNLATRSVHNGVLQWSPTENGSYQDFCSNIVYQVGAAGSCNIAPISEKIALNSPLFVKFVGIANTSYKLTVTASSTLGRAQYLETTTDPDGQGEFTPFTPTGSNGDNLTLGVRPLNISGDPDRASCGANTKLDATASPQTPPPSGPVAPIPAAPIVRHCKDKDDLTELKADEMICGLAGGQIIKGCNDPTDPKYDPKHPAIATAIGCIHTSPTEFVKDFLTFIIGIGGGLAFLMMLLGVFQMLTSAGNPETLAAGRDRLQSAIIGLLFIIFAVLLLQIIGFDILKLPGFGR